MTDQAVLAPLRDLSAALAALVSAAAPSLVAVHSHRSRSSGFVWRPGLVVTAEEALADEGAIELSLPDGKTIPAQLVGRDPTTDVAVLRAEALDRPAAPLGTATVATGSLALAVGAGNEGAVSALGIVSRAAGPWRSIRGGDIDARIDLDLRLPRIAEGGLALDASGQGIGMVVFGPRRRALVIPSATIERVAAQLAAHGRIARGYLGLSLQPVSLPDGGSGAMVMGVDPEGPSAAAGIEQGDIIIAWNGEPVQRLQRQLGPASVGQTVRLGLRRAGAAREVTVTVAERPAA
jgi:S1-C subfamily serine protease